MSEVYKPTLTEAEYARIDVLMKELEKVRGKEDVLKKELRKLIYKIESPR